MKQNKCTEAVVLAGGLGTRLRSVVKEIPKPMAPVAGQPFLKYLLDKLSLNGIKHVILSVGYKHEVIVEEFDYNYAGMELSYAVEETPMGTGGGLKLAFSKIKGDCAFVLNGDTFFNVDFRSLEDTFFTEKTEMCLSLKPMRNFNRYGIVETKGNVVTGFKAKQNCEKGNINGGVYLVKANVLEKSGLSGRFSFETDYMEVFYKIDTFTSILSDAYFIDIGIPDDYEKAQHDFLRFEQI